MQKIYMFPFGLLEEMEEFQNLIYFAIKDDFIIRNLINVNIFF